MKRKSKHRRAVLPDSASALTVPTSQVTPRADTGVGSCPRPTPCTRPRSRGGQFSPRPASEHSKPWGCEHTAQLDTEHRAAIGGQHAAPGRVPSWVHTQQPSRHERGLRERSPTAGSWAAGTTPGHEPPPTTHTVHSVKGKSYICPNGN